MEKHILLSPNVVTVLSSFSALKSLALTLSEINFGIKL